jgi:hypothetical protein
MTHIRLPLVLALAAATALPHPAHGQAASNGAFIVTLGTDTLNVEQFVRTGNVVEGDFLQRSPATMLVHYKYTLAADGSPASFEFTQRAPDGSTIPNAARNGTMRFGADTVAIELMRDTLVKRRVSAAHAYPLLINAFSTYEIAIGAMRSAKRDSMDVTMLQAAGGPAYVFPFAKRNATTYTVYFFGYAAYPETVTIDAAGRVTAVDASHTTDKVMLKRVASVDIQALATAFAVKDKAGQGMGQPSTRDTVNATVGTAHLWVDYGRPAKRGRTVFGPNGVLGDTLWRTGANAATQFKTDVELHFGSMTLPPGMYTLWTRARPGVWQLVFNKQVGQWGTDHDAKRDFVTVPLTEGKTKGVVERFTIAVEARGGTTGVLRMSWDTTELSLPFTLK